jgi:hypothetical protein
MKILIADDHIPDNNVPDDGIKHYVKQRYRSSDSDLIMKIAFMRKMLNRLRDAGFDVYECNLSSFVEKLIQEIKFDAAIIDLGWFADNAVPEREQAFQGWPIIEMVREKKPNLPIIMYSNRLFENSDIPNGAAIRGVLPVYKYFEGTCIDNLIAVLHFVHSTREQVKRIDTYTYKALSIITTVMIAIVPIFIVVGLGLLLLDRTDIWRLNVSLNLVIAALSSVFWKYLDMTRKNILP